MDYTIIYTVNTIIHIHEIVIQSHTFIANVERGSQEKVFLLFYFFFKVQINA